MYTNNLQELCNNSFFQPSFMAEEEETSVRLECAVCLQTCVHPVRLGCDHIFCFLCVKGVAIQSKRCPMCRREIPANFLENPTLVWPIEDEGKHRAGGRGTLKGQLSEQEDEEPKGGEGGDDENNKKEEEGGGGDDEEEEEEFDWFYEGHNGWWRYDERTSADLEAHQRNGDRSCELLIAGYLYTVDLEQMIQCRRNEPNRRRKIKRDRRSAPSKGVAGLRRTQHNSGNSYPAIASDDGPTASTNSALSADLMSALNVDRVFSSLASQISSAQRPRPHLSRPSRLATEERPRGEAPLTSLGEHFNQSLTLNDDDDDDDVVVVAAEEEASHDSDS